MFNCSCCGTEVNSPYFYNGGVYGYTCIKKVNPLVVKRKGKAKCVEVEALKIRFNTDVPKYGQAIVQFKSGKMTRINFLKAAGADGEYTNAINDSNFSFHNGKYWLIV